MVHISISFDQKMILFTRTTPFFPKDRFHFLVSLSSLQQVPHFLDREFEDTTFLQ